MDRYLVITVIGDDRPGLVELLAETIGSNGGNWLESRMAHLAGKFAGVLRVAVDGEHVEKLQQALAALSTRGIRVCAETGDATAEMVRAARLELVGSDQPGIVRDISTVLARHAVNVEELETQCVDAPMSGHRLFKAVAALQLPGELSVETLRTELEGLAHDLMVEIQLSELDR
jgi:glycine cleavage system regulatory protein